MSIDLNSAMQSGSLAGKYAVVTGGSRGIGAGIAIQFAKKGAKGVAITYIENTAAAEKTAAEIEKFGEKALIIQADISSNSIGETVIQGALKGFGSGILDIVVNNAAFLDLTKWETFMKITSANFQNMFQCNVLAPVKIIQAVMPHLPERGGRIINIS